MYLKEFNEFVMAERQQEYLRQAQQERLAKQARRHLYPNLALHCRGLFWLGQRLSAWGTVLQRRYTPYAEAAPLRAQTVGNEPGLPC